MFRFGSSVAILLWALPAAANWSALPITDGVVSTQAVWEVMQAARERWEVTQGSEFVVTYTATEQTNI